MKRVKIISLGLITLSLAACDAGSTSSSDVQTNSISGNGVANISVTATGCRTISANGGNCTVAINYSAPSNSAALNNLLSINALTNYVTNMTTQCTRPFSTSNQSCTITITSQSSTSNPLQAQIYPINQPNTEVPFTVGGGT